MDWLPVSLLDWLMLTFVGLLVLLMLYSLLRRPWRGKPKVLFEPAVMFSPEAATAFALLEQAVNHRLRVFAAVQMSEVLAVSAALGKAQREQAAQMMLGETLDFVLCSPGELMPRVVVALTDDSLSRTDGRHRHRLLEQIETAGLPVVHLSPKDWPEPGMLWEEIAALLQPDTIQPFAVNGRREPTLSLPDDEPDDEPEIKW
ncbi:DUF2726 domain-containing protein [Oceanimonas smirnovii]|uniref:DUF2726 domain-containing protein n=1 Tax=Oceanimonas smirnovii TaxID=264574 RepID=UPI003AAE8B6E